MVVAAMRSKHAPPTPTTTPTTILLVSLKPPEDVRVDSAEAAEASELDCVETVVCVTTTVRPLATEKNVVVTGSAGFSDVEELVLDVDSRELLVAEDVNLSEVEAASDEAEGDWVVCRLDEGVKKNCEDEEELVVPKKTELEVVSELDGEVKTNSDVSDVDSDVREVDSDVKEVNGNEVELVDSEEEFPSARWCNLTGLFESWGEICSKSSVEFFG